MEKAWTGLPWAKGLRSSSANAVLSSRQWAVSEFWGERNLTGRSTVCPGSCRLHRNNVLTVSALYVPQAVIVSLDSEEPIWIGRKQDANGAKVTTFLNEENILGYPEKLIQCPPAHPFDFITNFDKKKNWANKNIGVEMDSYYYTAENHERLVKNCPNAKFINGHLLVN